MHTGNHIQITRLAALTLLTPRTFLANSIASERSTPLPTLALKVTTPAVVVTAISLASTWFEYRKVDLTLVVIHASATSWPASGRRYRLRLIYDVVIALGCLDRWIARMTTNERHTRYRRRFIEGNTAGRIRRRRRDLLLLPTLRRRRGLGSARLGRLSKGFRLGIGHGRLGHVLQSLVGVAGVTTTVVLSPVSPFSLGAPAGPAEPGTATAGAPTFTVGLSQAASPTLKLASSVAVNKVLFMGFVLTEVWWAMDAGDAPLCGEVLRNTVAVPCS